MKIERQSHEVSIRHLPLSNWAIGVVIFMSMTGLSIWVFTANITISALLTELLYSVGCGLVVALLLYLSFFDLSSKAGIFAESTSVRINQTEEFVEIVQTRIYGRLRNRHYFYQVDRFRSYRKKLWGVTQYYLSLKLSNHRSVKFEVPLGEDRKATTKLIKELNSFMGKHRK